MSCTPDYQFRASYVLWHLRSFSQMNFREFVAARESVCGTKRKCPNARIFPELGADRLCHQPAGHSRP